MTTRCLLDTNVVIDVLRGASPRLRDQMSRHDGEMAISTVTIAELAYGAARSSDPDRNRAAVDGFIPFVDVLDLDARAAEHAGHIRADLASAGTPIGGYDLLIAGLARSRGLTVVTNNLREFGRVPGLLVEDWTTP